MIRLFSLILLIGISVQGSPRSKPLPGTSLIPHSQLNPLTAKAGNVGGMLLPLDEGSGSPRLYIGPTFAASAISGAGTDRLVTVTGAKWNPRPGSNFGTSKWGGPTISFLAITDFLNLGVNTDFIPLDQATIIIGYRKRDTTARLAGLFGVASNTAAHLCNMDMTTGGAVRIWWAQAVTLSVSGLALGDDVWAMSVGPTRGAELWQNGVLVGSASYPGNRTGNTNNFHIGDGNAFWDNGSDLADISFCYVFPRQISQEDIRFISADPFCFYDSGEDLFLGGTRRKQGDFFSPLIPPSVKFWW